MTTDWLQSARHERELEVHSIYDTADRTFQHVAEFEYGVTDRLMVAPEVVYSHGPEEGLHAVAVKLETRYQLGTFAVNRVLPGLYLEYEKPTYETGEIEAKLILSRYDYRGGDLSFNGTVEQTLETGSGSRFAYTLGYALPVGHGYRSGVEAYKDIDDGRVNAGPTLAFAPATSWWVVGGVGLPVNSANGNGAKVHLTVEFEF